MKKVALAILIAICAAIPFSPSLENGIVNCDDHLYILLSEQRGIGLTNFDAAIWMPQTWASYKVDRKVAALFQFNETTMMHAQSVFWHILNCVLVFYLFTLLKPNKTFCAFVCALIWAVHPLRVESVAWIASRKDVLSLFWLMLALLTWVKGRYSTSLALFLVGATAKQSIMTYPALVFILDWLIIRRELLWKRYVAPLVAAFFVALLTVVVQNAGGGCQDVGGIPFWWKCLNAMTAMGVYFRNTIWPTQLAPQCVIAWPKLPAHLVSCGLAFLGSLALLGILLINHKRDDRVRFPLAGLLFFFVAIAPMSGVVGFGYHAFADRFTYIPALGLSIALYGLCSTPILFGLVSASVIFSLMTWRQCAYWKNDLSLWSHTLEVDGDSNWHAHKNLGLYYYEYPHDLNKAVEHFAKVYQYGDDGQRESSLMCYVLSLLELGRRDEARPIYQDFSAWNTQAVRRARERGENISVYVEYLVPRILYMLGDPDLKDAALKDAAEVIQQRPDDINVKYLRYRLGQIPASEVRTDSKRQYIKYSFLNAR